MAEFKLSYTAKEIDEKLGKIDDLEVTSISATSDSNGNVTLEVSEISSSQDKGAVRFDIEQSLTEEQKAQARENVGAAKALEVEPAEDDIPKVFFGGALPQTKDDAVMSFRYISKTADISGYCKIKAQGSSSMNYPKKNQTIKLYKDAECTEKLKVNFKGWGKQSKFCFKANWIDISHARNIVTARLWGDVVKSRSNYAEIPELLRNSPNQGAIDGFPVKVYADGVYQGRYTINIPKDAWMANMDDELNTHCILCGESNADDRSLFRAAASVDGSDWSDEVHDDVPNAIKTRWNEVINFVMNSTDEEFVSDIGNYFDVSSLIDYYLFGLVSCGLDAFGKNQLYMTYDGQKWFATMYDMDSTWGLWWNGDHIVSNTYCRNAYQDFADGNGNLLYIRMADLFANAIKKRWEELKDTVLTAEHIVNRFERFTDICPPWLVAEDYADTTVGGAFASIPSKETNTIQQIRSCIRARIEYVSVVLGDVGVVDYSANPLSGVNWQDGSYEATSGIENTPADEHRTEKFKLQDCVYEFNYSNAGSWGALFVWDKDGNYVGRLENMSGPICFTAKSEYSYAIKVNKSDAFDSTLVSLMPKDNRATMCNVGMINLAELQWEAASDYVEASVYGVLIKESGSTTTAINSANAQLVLRDSIHDVSWTVSNGNTLFVASLIVFDSSTFIRTNMFTDVDTAMAYFKANNTKIIFNK